MGISYVLAILTTIVECAFVFLVIIAVGLGIFAYYKGKKDKPSVSEGNGTAESGSNLVVRGKSVVGLVWNNIGKITMTVLAVFLIIEILALADGFIREVTARDTVHFDPMPMTETDRVYHHFQTLKVYSFKEVPIPKAEDGKKWTVELSSISDVCIIRGEKILADGTRQDVGSVTMDGRSGSKTALPNADEYFIRLQPRSESGNESEVYWWQR